MRRTAILAAMVVMGLAACGGGGGQPPATQSAQPEATLPAPAPSASAAPAGDGESITGTLGGDAELEGGCAWVDDGTTRWNVQYPPDYTLTFDPVRLTGPDGVTAEEGDTVTVTGAEAKDVMTICQVGPVWAATSVTIGG